MSDANQPVKKCGRTACTHSHVTHRSTMSGAYYCVVCARRINESAPDMCVILTPAQIEEAEALGWSVDPQLKRRLGPALEAPSDKGLQE